MGTTSVEPLSEESMVDCIKKQKENYKGVIRHRCINKDASLFREIVAEAQCAVCPMRKPRKSKDLPCKKKLEMIRQAREISQLPVIEPQEGGYPSCPFRYESKGKELHCSITSLPVTPEVCSRCDKETREHEAKFGEKVKNYFGAVRRWVANGRPTRSQEEIDKLFKENCESCERYDKERHACKNCGCTVSMDASPLSNKLAMASERCPLGRF